MIDTVIAKKFSAYVFTDTSVDAEFEEIKLKGILFGNDECFDTDGFYQYLHDTETDKLYKVYFDLVDQNGDPVEDDLGSVDYSKSPHCEVIEDEAYKKEIITIYYKDEYEYAKNY